jgi:hypothetical protein
MMNDKYSNKSETEKKNINNESHEKNYYGIMVEKLKTLKLYNNFLNKYLIREKEENRKLLEIKKLVELENKLLKSMLKNRKIN